MVLKKTPPSMTLFDNAKTNLTVTKPTSTPHPTSYVSEPISDPTYYNQCYNLDCLLSQRNRELKNQIVNTELNIKNCTCLYTGLLDNCQPYIMVITTMYNNTGSESLHN